MELNLKTWIGKQCSKCFEEITAFDAAEISADKDIKTIDLSVYKHEPCCYDCIKESTGEKIPVSDGFDTLSLDEVNDLIDFG